MLRPSEAVSLLLVNARCRSRDGDCWSLARSVQRLGGRVWGADLALLALTELSRLGRVFVLVARHDPSYRQAGSAGALDLGWCF